MVITRFAPSPTGKIHIGNIRTALIGFLFAKNQGGQFMLRLDDTDQERSKEEYVTQIKESLEWLGLKWDIFARQSERSERYEEVRQKLIADGRLYPCYESGEELEMKRKMQLGRGLPPIYDRAALKLSDEQKQQLESEGKKPHWRFKLNQEATIAWDDLIKGPTKFEAKNLSDPILIRENGAPTYMLPSAIDDTDFSISHIIRGEDHVSNTAIQIQLFEAIGATPPQMAHHSLMKSKEGKISKRTGGFDIESLREDGIEAMAIVSYLEKLGTSESIRPFTDMQTAIDAFNIGIFGKAAATYDVEELKRLNSKIIHSLEFANVAERLKNLDLNDIDQNFWETVKLNLNRIQEIGDWWHICKAELAPIIDSEDRDFLIKAATLLPDGQWDENTWPKWIDTLKQETDRKGKSLFMPLRKALTAQEHGPELKHILPLIDQTKAKARLNGEAA